MSNSTIPPTYNSVKVRIAIRSNANPHTKYREYQIPYEKWMTVNDALDYIQDVMEEEFAYRRYCGVKKCGMCAVRVNGKEVLACWELVSSEEITIEPLANLPVHRDLVIDRSEYEKAVQDARPYLARSGAPAEFPETLRHSQMKNAPALDCLNCLACVSAVDNSRGGIMPALMVQVAQQALDPRDAHARERAQSLADTGVLDQQWSKGSAVCPAGIDIDVEIVQPLRDLAQSKSGLQDWEMDQDLSRNLDQEER